MQVKMWPTVANQLVCLTTDPVPQWPDMALSWVAQAGTHAEFHECCQQSEPTPGSAKMIK